MAISYDYNATYTDCVYVYRATGGGVTFSANLASSASFDYFTDTAVNNDAIYFASQPQAVSNLKVNVGTARVGGTGVWEYFCVQANAWRAMHDITDPSVGFTVAGAHTIIFPIQISMYSVTVNGIAGYSFIRYRLTGGTVTEGGANVTTKPSMSTGQIRVLGATDSDYATFESLYNWMVTNVPEVYVYRQGGIGSNGGHYEFRNCNLSINSRLKSTNQTIHIGGGHYGAQNLDYLESGIKVGTDGWRDPSYFFFAMRAGGNVLNTTGNTKIYGGVFGLSSWTYDGITTAAAATYFGTPGGELIGLTVDSRAGYYSNTLTSDRQTTCGEIISTSFPTNYPTNMRISNPSAYVWGIYAAGGTVTGVNYALPSSSVFQWNQNGGSNYQIYARDLSPALPTQATAPRAVGLTIGSWQNLTNVYYNDVSAGTFTDYTTQANNDTADDVPLSGDVGDCYYFRYSATSSAYQMPLQFTITGQSNDYVYAWEYYYSGSWRAMNKTWDLTDNFTKSGAVWNANTSWSTVSVNSVSGYWYRLRIVTKGTTTPTFTRVKARIATGVGNWLIYEQASATLKVVDESNTALQDVAVTFVSNDSTTTNLTTDSSGLTTKTYFTITTYEFDPVSGDSAMNVLRTDKNPHTITISKTGYETLTVPLVLKANTDLTLALKTAINTLEDDKGNVFDRVDKTNSGTTNLRRKITKL